MQNVIRKRVRAREARLPSDGRLLGNWSFFKSAQREISFIASPLRLTTVDHHGTRARQEESSRRAEIGARPFPSASLGRRPSGSAACIYRQPRSLMLRV